MSVGTGVLVGVEFGDADLTCTAGGLTKCLSDFGEPEVRAGGEGHKAEVKRCGGQLGVLRGGTGGKKLSETGDTEGLTLAGALERILVLSLGTGLAFPSTPSFFSSSFPSPGVVCLRSGTGIVSPSSVFLGVLKICLSLGTGLLLSLGVGLLVSPSLFSLSCFLSTGTGTGLSLRNTSPSLNNSNLSH